MPDINEGKPWSQQDDDDLRLAVSGGESLDRVATFLCRSPDEVKKRAAELRLRWAENATLGTKPAPRNAVCSQQISTALRERSGCQVRGPYTL